MSKKYKLERESDAPADWKTNAIMMRDASGAVIEVDVPDDTEEVTGDAGDD